MNVGVTVDGEPAAGRLWCPYMDLSSGRALGRPAKYEVLVPVADFLKVLEPLWAEVVLELRRDDRITGQLDALGKADYPSLKQLLDTPELLAEAVNFVREALFETFLPEAIHTGKGTAAIDSIDGVRHERGVFVCIYGACVCF